MNSAAPYAQHDWTYFTIKQVVAGGKLHVLDALISGVILACYVASEGLSAALYSVRCVCESE